ncbi:DUF2201 family putative metallopeptidase [Shinella zoogloeoides]|uniref:vWA domain-containing protein n=1 Tax=Shinella zoogloeoides TaxID=352475 RepID=UPI00299EA77E|nr:VWA-like domain-containing protein [Shinella zoogloeoides]
MSATELVDKARAGLMLDQPFYATLSLYLELVEDTTCKTMWTDGARLGFNPSYVEGLKPSELRTAVAHNVSHCARLHHVRRGNRDAKRWDDACDFSINAELKAAGFNLPDGAPLNPDYDALSEEEIYQRLKAKDDDQDNGKKPQPPGDGSAPAPASGGKGQAPEKPGATMGQVRDPAPGHEPAKFAESESEWKANVRQALAVAKKSNAGSIPGHLETIDEVTIAPRYNWKEELRAFIDQSNVKDYSWMHPNRRYIGQGLILPGLVSDSLAHLVCVIDDSSSIDMTAFNACAAEAKAALNEGSADKVTVVFCNAAVHRVETFERGDDMSITARGSGGTRFAPAFEWIADNAPDASAIVYLTDLDCRVFGEEPAAPVLWVAYGEKNAIARRAAAVPFGEVLHIAA